MKKNLTPEQIEQLKKTLMTQQHLQQGGEQHGHQKKPNKIRSFINTILGKLQGMIGGVDKFINFITKKNVDHEKVVESARYPILFGTYVIIIFVVFGLGWTLIAPLDSASVAVGSLINYTKRKAITHQYGGTLKKLYVEVGDRVKQGDKLVKLDDTVLQSNYKSQLSDYRNILANESRIIALLDQSDAVTYPKELLEDIEDKKVKKIIDNQNSLFHSMNRHKEDSKKALLQKNELLKKNIDAATAKQESLNSRLKYTNDKLNSISKLQKDGFSHNSALLESAANKDDVIAQISITNSEIAKYKQEIDMNNAEILKNENEFAYRLLSELSELQYRKYQTKDRLLTTKDILQKSLVISPSDGVINQIYYTTIGSVVPQGHSNGNPILEISPDNDKLIIEARIAPQHIDSVHEGLITKIRFSAFKSRTTPLFKGKVLTISNDIVPWDKTEPMNDPKLSKGYYLVRIELDEDVVKEIITSRKINLVAGMQAEVQIVTGTRTLMKYLLDPILDSMFKGLKEK